MQGRFADVWSDVLETERAALERQKVERRYRRMLALTDVVLRRLEQRNLTGQRDLDQVMQRNIARTLQELTPQAQGRFPATTSVQEALDGIFEVQEELMVVLQRILHWDRVVTASSWDGEKGTGKVLARRTA